MTDAPEALDRVRPPRDEDIDVFGMTHVGKRRTVNEDQFLIASLHKAMEIRQTSLPPGLDSKLTSRSHAFLMLIADGVGGHAAGQEASGRALEEVAHYVTHTMKAYYRLDESEEEEFLRHLQLSVMRCHATVSRVAGRDPDRRGMATTLTLVKVLWPSAYVVQVGDSRLYHLRGGELIQVTKDQTVAQDLVDRGVLPEDRADGSRWSHVLSSAIGSSVTPATSKVTLGKDDVLLLCTDGLTKHVSNDEITRRLTVRESSEATCEKLIQDTLDGGGSDNVTVIVGRIRQSSPA